MRALVRGTAGLLGGLVGGVALTLSLVVLRAIVEDVYLHGLADLVHWISFPLVVLPLLGVWAAVSAREMRLWLRLIGGVGGIVGGAAVGALIGTAVGGGAGTVASAPWSGGILGAGAGFVCGVTLTPLLSPDDHLRDPGVRAVLLTALAALASLAAFGLLESFADEPAPPPLEDAAPEPAAGSVESVMFMVGDPGGPPDVRYPVLEKVENEVERWAGMLPDDSAVTVLVLGDVVYPDGLAAPDDPGREDDSLRLIPQIDMVSGAVAVEAGVRGVFMPGNHDWGRGSGPDGAARLHNLDRFLSGWRDERGTHLELAPPPGTGGPEVIDVGRYLRIVILDTAWWLLEGEEELKDDVLQGVAEAFRTAGERTLVLAAHHPFVTGGPHGGAMDLRRTFGIRFLLTRAGTLLQDLGSPPYRDLLTGLRGIFAEHGPPAVFAGGHEHSLQVFRSTERDEPRTSLVVGSAIGVTDVADAPGMEVGLAAPGYAKLFVTTDGRIELFVEAAPADFLTCPRPTASGEPDAPTSADEGDRPDTCMRNALESFAPIWAGTVGPE